jgi:hypothetical protein
MPSVPIILSTRYADLGHGLLGTGLLIDRIVSKNDAQELMGRVRSLIPVRSVVKFIAFLLQNLQRLS